MPSSAFPYMPTSAADASNTAAAASQAGMGPRIGGGMDVNPWAGNMPSYMLPQQQAAEAPAAYSPGYMPPWLQANAPPQAGPTYGPQQAAAMSAIAAPYAK